MFRLIPFTLAYRREHGRFPTYDEVVFARRAQEWRQEHPEATKEEVAEGLVVELTVILLVLNICYTIFRFVRERGEWETVESE